MKINKLFLTASIILALAFQSVFVLAQPPQKVSYQMVVRDASGELVKESTVGVKMSILQGSSEGSAVYVETHAPQSNVNGLISLDVGSGTPVQNTFAGIDWANGPYFLKAETDPEGGSSYSISGISEILSVPYALHAKTAETVTGTVLERIEALEAQTEPLLIANGYTDPRDGNHYDVVKIGNQVWMAENLAFDAGTGCYTYNNDESYVETYGKLYTWSAAMAGSSSSSSNPSGVQGVCPDGWHLPSDDEWEQLAQYVSDQKGPYSKSGDDWDNVGKHLKATGTIEDGDGLWLKYNPDDEGTDEFGFSALPGGYRDNNGYFDFIGLTGIWWSATEYSSSSARTRYLHHDHTIFYRYYANKVTGFSVRCLRD